MSQAKMNEYKEYKKNKKQILAKQKKKKIMNKVIIWAVTGLVLCGLVAALAVTARNMYRDYKAGQPDYSVSGFILDDLSGLNETETAAE